jgi:hypothetical protein
MFSIEDFRTLCMGRKQIDKPKAVAVFGKTPEGKSRTELSFWRLYETVRCPNHREMMLYFSYLSHNKILR